MSLAPEVLTLLFAAGLSAGFVDAVAGGGGLITVPVLMWVGVPPQMVLGTNKMQACCGTLLAVVRYAKAGLVTRADVRLTVLVTFLFALLGTYGVTQVSNDLLKKLVPWMLLAIAIYAFITPKFGQVHGRARLSPMVFALLVGSVLGFYDGFFGPGTGSFWTLACISLLGLELTRATAYTKVVNLTSNVASLLAFLRADCVRFDIAAVMIVGQLIGARLGSGLVVKHGAPFVRVVFLIVVFALTLKLLADQL
jgi:uncharacterized membrane protein YfcA